VDEVANSSVSSVAIALDEELVDVLALFAVHGLERKVVDEQSAAISASYELSSLLGHGRSARAH